MEPQKQKELFGYNNAVQILNDIGKTCYSNGKIGAKGRSMNIEDIEKVLDKTKWKPEDYSDTINGIQFNTNMGIYRYDKTRYYPYIYKFEKNANIDGIESKSNISRSMQPIEDNQGGYYLGSTYSREQANSYIELTQSYWTEAQKLIDAIDNVRYRVLFYDSNVSNELNFYLASRFTRTAVSKEAYFGIQEIEKRNIAGLNLFFSNGNGTSVTRSVRPIVEVDLSKVKIENTKSNGDTAVTGYVLTEI